MNIKLIIILSLLSLSILYLMYLVVLTTYRSIVRKIEEIIEQSKEDIDLRNEIFSHLYFIRDMGPNVSAVVFPFLIISGEETIIQLIVIFILGIIMKKVARKFTKKFGDLVTPPKGDK